MDPEDVDEITARIRDIVAVVRGTFEDLSGEEFQLDNLLLRYPLVAFATAAGVGAVAGWVVGYRLRPRGRSALPPPPPEETPLERAIETVRGAGQELRDRIGSMSPDKPASPLDYLEALLPDAGQQVRRFLAEGVSDDVTIRARHFVDSTIEPALQSGVERMVARDPDSRLSSFLRLVLERIDTTEEPGPSE